VIISRLLGEFWVAWNARNHEARVNVCDGRWECQNIPGLLYFAAFSRSWWHHSRHSACFGDAAR